MERYRFVDAEQADIISQISQDETGKRQYYRPVYSLHKWWARRPGALFRAILLLTQHRDRKIFETLSNGSLSPQSEYFRAHNLSDVVVLDPFMGGGTTLAEANRLGAKVIGCDINPVSYWIVRETLKPIDLEKLDSYFHQVEQSAGERIKAMYRTRCTHCCQPAEGLYVFWVRYVECPHCHQPVHLYKRTLLNEGLSRNKALSSANPATVFCPSCFNLCSWDGIPSCTCPHCGHTFEPRSGTYKQGLYTCPHCEAPPTQLLTTLQNGQTLKERLVAIEYWCPTCRGRLYKSPDAYDLYSELSNFFYVWLAELIDHPYFASEHVPTDNEAIVNEKMDKGEEEYQNLLRNVFREAHRVLKEDGKLIFTFHHTKWRAWWTLHCAISQSGFYVIDTFPVMSEYRVNPHIRNKQSLDMDLVLICAKDAVQGYPLSINPSDILQRVEQELAGTSVQKGNKYFLHCVGELLKTASANAGIVDYDWFSNSLSYF